MATSELDNMWDDAFHGKARPELYTGEDFNEDGFRPLADPVDFITDISKLTTSQLYAQAANNQCALQQAQEEYLELEKLVNSIKSRDHTAVSTTKNPQALPPQQEFEERKEATLYGYKYDPNKQMASYGRWPDASEQEKRDLRSYQDPFTQGGFVPNDRQYKGIMNKAKDRRNPDGWIPVEKDGKKLIPKMAARVNEKAEYVLLSGLLPLPLARGIASKPATRTGTPDLETVANGGRDALVNKRLRNTRFNGAKVPITRDVSEAPSLPVSRASTPKRKRGDTPLLSYDPNGSPIKKPKIVVTEGDLPVPPRRKHHNQYTKAKEKAALEAMAARRAVSETESRLYPSGSTAIGPVATILVDSNNDNNYPWSHLTDQEKRDFHWNNDTLLLAVRDDPTWLNDDPKTRQKWTKKILESKYPVRTYSMYKKWDYWRLMGEDKRPRNKKKSKHADMDDDEHEMDEASEMATATPSPLSRSITMHDLDDEEDLGRGSIKIISPGPSRLGRGEMSIRDYSETDDDLHHEDIGDGSASGSARESRQSSRSDSASQTIRVSREDVSLAVNPLRRMTRAARKASI